jgi:CRISPR-associated protein Cmr6
MEEVKGRRRSLENEKVNGTTNAALWLDKYIAIHKDDDSKKVLVKDVAEEIPTSEEYEKFFERWKKNLSVKCSVLPKEAKVQSRLAIGLGADSVLETSITLHHTYGTPYIPGSALKGLAAHYARNYLDEKDWGKKSDAYKELFGTTEKSGCVDFYDALYVPNTGHPNGDKKQALWADIITVHHKEYYQGAEQAPADWDSPTPIPFLTATGKYLIALDGPEKWVETAYEILWHALCQLGVGAKTSSGYGRMKLGERECQKEETIKADKAPNLEDLEEHKGIISKFYSNSGKGKVMDMETDKMYNFHRSVIRGGNDLPQKQKVFFKLDKNSEKILAIRKRYA